MELGTITPSDLMADPHPGRLAAALRRLGGTPRRSR
jgi:hypothetical protein